MQSNQYNVLPLGRRARHRPVSLRPRRETRFLVGVIRGSLSSLIGPAERLFFSSARCFFSVHLISRSPPCRALASLLVLRPAPPPIQVYERRRNGWQTDGSSFSGPQLFHGTWWVTSGTCDRENLRSAAILRVEAGRAWCGATIASPLHAESGLDQRTPRRRRGGGGTARW